jgi:hypothetical protein
MERKKFINQFAQVAIPVLTIGSQIITSLKFPQYGLIVNLIAQPFWLYSTWKAYKEAGQIGVFINTVIFTAVTAIGVINYWLL